MSRRAQWFRRTAKSKEVTRFSDNRVLLGAAESGFATGHHIVGNRQAAVRHRGKDLVESFHSGSRIIQNLANARASSVRATQTLETTGTPDADRRSTDAGCSRADDDCRHAYADSRRVLYGISRSLRPQPSPCPSLGAGGAFRATGCRPDVQLTFLNVPDAPDAADVIRGEGR